MVLKAAGGFPKKDLDLLINVGMASSEFMVDYLSPTKKDVFYKNRIATDVGWHSIYKEEVGTTELLTVTKITVLNTNRGTKQQDVRII